MTLDVAEIVALALLAVLCVGLLRSNADLTRRLDRLEVAAERARRRQAASGHAAPADQPGAHHHLEETTDMTDPTTDAGDTDSDLVPLDGVTPEGQPTSFALEGEQPALVAFLSTSCGICTGLWERLQAGELEGEGPAVRTVVVTKSAELEDVDRVKQLAAAGGVPTVMSTEAWDDYEVPGSPYFLVIGGEPRDVVSEGTASGWQDVTAIVRKLETVAG